MSGATSVFSFRESVDVLASMLATRLPMLRWRHHGIGVLQAYLDEHEGVERRVHIWDPSLVLPGMERSGGIHDHRFDMTSFVVLGEMQHTEIAVQPALVGALEEYEVVNARESMLKAGSWHTAPALTGRSFHGRYSKHVIGRGHGYTFARHHFHESKVADRTVTIVEKRNQEGHARILGVRGEVLQNAFGNPENLRDDAPLVVSLVAETAAALMTNHRRAA